MDLRVERFANRQGNAWWSDDGGDSVTECCYTDRGTRLSSLAAKIVEEASTGLTFCHASRTIDEEKISLNISRRFIRPLWMAGVLTSRPNFNAR